MGDGAAAAVLWAYYVLALFLLPVGLRFRRRVPPEVVRKTQHVAYGLSIFWLLEGFSTWPRALLAAVALVLVAWPALRLLERTRWFERLLVRRGSVHGELRRQMLLVQLTFAALLLVFWGGLGEERRALAAVAVMAWTFGDAAAALVGGAWGRRRIRLRWVDGHKTVEGAAAMAGVAWVAVFATLVGYVGTPWPLALAAAAVLAPVSAATELLSRRGVDTLTVPLAAGAALLPWAWVPGFGGG